MKPILLLVFNRPEHTQQVLDQVRRIKPKQLFVSADGPRHHILGEKEKCAAVRALFDEVGWDCTVHVNFFSENNGCKRGVQAGISWFFEHVESGIILEDDCLPDLTFFDFCDQLLDRHQDDASIMHISGNNPDPSVCQHLKSSYFFSKFPLVWGWATWRRAWKLYDPAMTELEKQWSNPKTGLHKISVSKAAKRYLLDKFERTRTGEIDTWDYAWFYSILKTNGLCLTPVVNLVKNIGFGVEATHTQMDIPVYRNNVSTVLPFPLTHPQVKETMAQIEKRLFYASQKSWARLFLRSLAPWYFYRKPNK